MDKKAIIILLAVVGGFLALWCLVMFWIGPMIVSDPILDPCWEYVQSSEELQNACGHIEGITLDETTYEELSETEMLIPVEAWTKEGKYYAIDLYIEKVEKEWVVTRAEFKGEIETPEDWF